MNQTQVDSIEFLIGEDMTEQAIKEIRKYCKENSSPFLTDAILLEGRYKNIKKAEHRGVINDKERIIELNKIRQTSLELVNSIRATQHKIEKIDSHRFNLYMISDYARFDYYNYQRIFELMLMHKIDFQRINVYPQLRTLNIVNELGTLNEFKKWLVEDKPTFYKTDIEAGLLINFYMKSIVEMLSYKLNLKDITNLITSKRKIKEKIKPGDFFYAQIGFYFKDIDEFKEGERQLRLAYYKSNKVYIDFVFDAWECSSSSGRFTDTSNRKIVTPICLVRSMEEIEKVLKIHCSCLAIGNYFNNMKIGR